MKPVRELKTLFLIIVIGLVSIFFYNEITKLFYKFQLLEAKLGQNVRSDILPEGSVSSNDNNVVVIYNRVPKTGSTSFVGVAYALCKKNKFRTLHVNVTGNNHILSLNNQYDIVKNISYWNDMKPAIYHGHFAFIDFARFSNLRPLYINIIRKPLDRLVSYYYFLRYGDDFRPHLVRKKHGDTETFDECVRNSHPDCDPNNMWLQVPFFCGHSFNCWKPGNKWALEEAKKNLINNYLIVGVTEELDDFIAILELVIPRVFKGAMDHYVNSNKSHLRQTAQKQDPSEETIRKIESSTVWRMENEFYEFALEQFQFIRHHTLDNRSQKYFYEKIRPK